MKRMLICFSSGAFKWFKPLGLKPNIAKETLSDTFLSKYTPSRRHNINLGRTLFTAGMLLYIILCSVVKLILDEGQSIADRKWGVNR